MQLPKINFILTILLITLLSCSVIASPQQTQTSDDQLQQRLEKLCEKLDQQREANHVPGLAIAVVRGDEVLLTRGLGVADVETDRPVTEETLFAIGSSTKSFTATAIAMLVDEGRMSWDDPVTKYLPSFDLNVDTGEESITIRDLLCHRTGMTRMSVLWAADRASRQQIIEAAATAEPWSNFREAFHYNNVMFLAAGMAAGDAAGTSYEQLITERILEPLNMNDSNLSVKKSRADAPLAKGYVWDDESEEFEHQPMRELEVIAPAGAINSNVKDMANWLRLLLNRGEFEGKRLVSEEQLKQTWSPQIQMADEISYGLGWMIHDYQGRRVIEHGGNIDGFAANVAILPESNLGCVVLTNVTASPLQSLARNLVWEALLGEPEDDLDETDESDDNNVESYDEYLSKYIANFAIFKNSEFTVLVQNDSLAVDVPGQTIYELKPPDDEGKWYFALTDQIAVSFNRNDEEKIVSMNMFQGGMKFELPRKGVTIEPEVPLDQLKKYLGSYRSEQLDANVTVLIQNNRLAVDVPGQMVYQLHPPDEDGKWALRADDAIAISFVEAPDGEVTAIKQHRNGQSFELPRVGDPPSQDLPSVEELMTLRQTKKSVAALQKMSPLKLTGKVRFVHQGAEGVTTLWMDATQYRQDIELGVYGSIQVATDGEHIWQDSAFAPFEQLQGKYREQAMLNHPAAWICDWREAFDTVEVVAEKVLEGAKVYEVTVKPAKSPQWTLLLDATTGDILQAETTTLHKAIGGFPTTYRYQQYVQLNGLRLPLRLWTENEMSGRTVIDYSSINTTVEVEDDLFVLTAEQTETQ